MIGLLRNTSIRPTDEVQTLVEFALARTGGLEGGRIAVWVKDGNRGQGWAADRERHRRARWAGRCRYRITLNVPTPEDPHRIYGGIWFSGHSSKRGTITREEKRAMYDAGQRKIGRWPLVEIRDWREQLVHLAAHEAAHLLQWDRGRGASEVFCEEFAAKTLDHWRLTNAAAVGMIASTGNPDPEEDPMTSTPRTPRNIDQLRAAYMALYDGFALDTSDLAAELSIDRPAAARLLKRLAQQGLVDSYDVNQEAQGNARRGQYRELTWQCNETYDSATPEQAAATFDQAFGLDSPEQEETPVDATEIPTVDLVKIGNGAVWHLAADLKTETATAVCGRSGSITAGPERDVDSRVTGHQGALVCAACITKTVRPTPGAPTTEEVTMSTTAAQADQAETENAEPAAEQAEPKAETPKAASKPTVEIEDGLENTLLKAVKQLKPKPELKTAPSGSYTTIRVGKTPVGYLHPITRKGLLVHLTISAAAAKKLGVKGAEAHAKGAVKSKVYLTQLAGVEPVVKAMEEAAKTEA